MKRPALVVALATIAFLVLPAGGAPAQEQEERPLHPRLLEAKTVVIQKNVREFKEWRDFKVEMKRWGRYDLLEDDDAEGELVILLTDQQFGNQWVGAEGRTTDTQSGTTAASVGVYLVVYEADTGRMIWAEGRPRLEQGTGPKRSAAKTLVQHLKNRVEEAAEELAEHPEEDVDR